MNAPIGSGPLGAVIVNPGGILSVSNEVNLGIQGDTTGSRGFLWMNGSVGTLNNIHIADVQQLVSYFGNASLVINSGGGVTQDVGTLSIAHTDGRGSNGTFIVAGAGSRYQNTSSVGDTVVGGATTGLGSLLISGGGLFSVPHATVNLFQRGYASVDTGGTLSSGGTVFVTGGTLVLGSGAINSSGMLINLGGRLVRNSAAGTISLPAGGLGR